MLALASIQPHTAPQVYDLVLQAVCRKANGKKITAEKAGVAVTDRVIPSVAYTDPEVAWVGLTEDQAKAQGIKVKKGLFPCSASGRAIANGRDEGVTKLLFHDSPEAHGHGKILGGGMVGTHAGDMIGEIAHRARTGNSSGFFLSENLVSWSCVFQSLRANW